VRDAKHASVPLRRVRAGEVRCEEFLYELKSGPAGGRLRRPSSAGGHLTNRASAGFTLRTIGRLKLSPHRIQTLTSALIRLFLEALPNYRPKLVMTKSSFVTTATMQSCS
jgi:hypothetical protein